MQTNIEPTRLDIADILIDNIISEMTLYLMDDYGYSLEQSLKAIYTSKTIELLQKADGELYVQSPAYVYDMLIKELHLYPLSVDAYSTKVADDSEPKSYRQDSKMQAPD